MEATVVMMPMAGMRTSGTSVLLPVSPVIIPGGESISRAPDCPSIPIEDFECNLLFP